MAFFDKAKTGREVPSLDDSKPARTTPTVAPPIPSSASTSPVQRSATVSAPSYSSIQSTTTAVPSRASVIDLTGTKKEEVLSELERGATENVLGSIAEGESVRTSFDAVVDVLQKHDNKATFHKIISESKLKSKVAKYVVKVLARSGLVDVYYPVNPFASPVITFKNTQKDYTAIVEQELGVDKKLLEKYTVISDYVVADVNIWSVPFENTPIYQVVPHDLSHGTRAMLLELREELARIMPVKFEDITDPRKVLELKQRFFLAAKDAIKKAIPEVDDNQLKVLAGVLLHFSYGLGDMEIIMSDNWLEEIAINGAKEPLSVYHRKYGWLKTTKRFNSETEIYNFTSQIGRKVGKQISSLFPIMDAHMLSGDRVAATLFPISTEGDTLTIRRFSRNPWTVTHMIDPKNPTMSKEMMAFLWLCIQYELNVLVVGGTASGKTSVLNTVCSLIPPTNRIISIEDTRELSLPDALHWNWVPLSSRPKNSEGLGEVTMLDLMVASLRMRPDRIIVGEIRRREQAEAMFEAMHTGHSVNATMHADTAEQLKRRLTQPPIQIPENEVQALQLVVVQYRDRRRGMRRTLEVAEFLPGSSEEKININYLYRWRPRTDGFEKDNPSIRITEDLNLHTGMTSADIDQDLSEKQDVLQWMLSNGIRDVNKVGQIMRIYYKYPKLLLDTVADEGKLKGLSRENA